MKLTLALIALSALVASPAVGIPTPTAGVKVGSFDKVLERRDLITFLGSCDPYVVPGPMYYLAVTRPPSELPPTWVVLPTHSSSPATTTTTATAATASTPAHLPKQWSGCAVPPSIPTPRPRPLLHHQCRGVSECRHQYRLQRRRSHGQHFQFSTVLDCPALPPLQSPHHRSLLYHIRSRERQRDQQPPICQ